MTKRHIPDWLKISAKNSNSIKNMQQYLDKLSLNTICKEANCPNIYECFQNKTATFMILGKNCSRNCSFCNVSHNEPEPADDDESLNIANAIIDLGLNHVVITSVTRDDLEDGGAEQFVKTVKVIREKCRGVTIELLIPDFQGKSKSLNKIINAFPEIIGHNVETVPFLYPVVRAQADFERSKWVLEYIKRKAPKIYVKSGIMLGLGESQDQVLKVMEDIRSTGCDILTIGQYLRPSLKHLEVVEYISPEIFDYYSHAAYNMGYLFVQSAPFVRSSFNAGEFFKLKK